MKVTFSLRYEELQESLTTHLKAEQQPPALSPGSLLGPNAVGVMKPAGPPQKPRFMQTTLGWVFILVIAIVIFVIFHQDKPAPGVGPLPVPTPPPGNVFTNLFVNILPYVFVFILIWFFFLRQLRQGAKSKERYNNDPFHLQERTVELLETGLRITAPHQRHEFDWMAYQRLVVTDNLFMIYTGQQMYQIIPKRAFASLAEIEAFLRILQDKIPDRRAGAFPVMVGSAKA